LLLEEVISKIVVMMAWHGKGKTDIIISASIIHHPKNNAINTHHPIHHVRNVRNNFDGTATKGSLVHDVGSEEEDGIWDRRNAQIWLLLAEGLFSFSFFLFCK
jgi:hypothetical protein